MGRKEINCGGRACCCEVKWRGRSFEVEINFIAGEVNTPVNNVHVIIRWFTKRCAQLVSDIPFLARRSQLTAVSTI